MSVYKELWHRDENAFSVSGRSSDGQWVNENADILLDEQVRASGRRNRDLAAQPLFAYVNEDKLFGTESHVSFNALLDNYLTNARDPEEYSEQELAEIERFLEIALRSTSMEIAYAYVRDKLQLQSTRAAFDTRVHDIWFAIYTNYYRGRSTKYCSGFEHVFVGEGKYDTRGGPGQTKGEVTGYHFWSKFYLDEKYGRVNYMGYKYDLGGAGPENPTVATLQMVWNYIDAQGNFTAELFKPKGGFFIGISPEAQLAMATVAYFESVVGRLENQRQRVRLDEGWFDLVMYRNTEELGGQGRFVRSFFPVYLGSGDEPISSPGDTPVVRPVEVPLQNDGPVRIVAALPNPTGSEDHGEWVELTNSTTAPISLDEWELRDKMGRPRELTDSIEPGQTLRVPIPRIDPNRMQLTNREGLITLHHGEVLVAAVRYPRAMEDEVIKFL